MEKQDKRFKNIFAKCKKYITIKKDLDLISRAYHFAKTSHEGVFRIGGEPYISHLLDTAEILIDLNAGPTTIAAGLLHDCVEDVDAISNEMIEILFGKQTATLVDAVTKVNVAEKSKAEKSDLTLQKLFIAMGKDVRTIIVKIADRLSNMRTLAPVSAEQQTRVSGQTLEIYAPVARTLGLNEIAREMEETCLFYLDRKKYTTIKKFIEKKVEKNNEQVELVKKDIKKALKNLKIKCSIYTTTKDIYSIIKAEAKGKRKEEIQDIITIHILTKDNMSCYMSLGAIHSMFTPYFGKVKDYIASPKYNMYQAIHSQIITHSGETIKVAIKTNLMDKLFSLGVASKWAYNEKKGYNSKKEQEEIRRYLNIVKDLDKINAEDGVSINEYVKLLREDVFNKNQYIYVYDPKGNVYTLPIGATVLDFAFRVYPKTAFKTSKAYINGLKTDLYRTLKNGVVVSLDFASDTKVKKIWFKNVKTNYAKIKITRAIERKEVKEKKVDE